MCNNKQKSQKGTMKKLKPFLKWILSTVFAAIIAYMVWESIDSLGSLRNLLIYIQALLLVLVTQSTPLWATSLMVLLCCLYIYLKIRKINQSLQPQIKNIVGVLDTHQKCITHVMNLTHKNQDDKNNT